MNDVDLLARAGTALYGERWQTDLARALDLSDARRVRQWLASERRIPPGIWADIAQLLRARQAEAAALLAELDSHTA